jgi:hypothetical protein
MISSGRDKAAREIEIDDNTSNKQKYLDKKEYDRSLRKLRRKLENSEKNIEMMETELLEMDKELMTTASSSESAGIYSKYQDLRNRLNKEMNNWTLYSHEVDEYLKTNG